MIPQNSVLLNTQYFTNLTNACNSAQSCAELQALVTEAFASISAVKTSITAELASLTPILSLLSPPGNLSALVSWVGNFITYFLTPSLKPTVTYAAQLTALATQISSITSAISSASVRFPSCSISVPVI